MYRRWLVYRRRTCGLLPGLIVRLLANKCQECALQWCWTSLEREMKWTEAWSSRVVTLNSYDSSMMISSLTWSPSMGRPISAMRRSSSSFPASGSSSSFSSFCCSSGKKRTNEGRREERDSVWVCRKNWQETRTFIHPSWRGSWWLQWREYWRIHRWLLCFLFVFLGGDFLFKWQHKKNEAHRCCFSVKTATPMWVLLTGWCLQVMKKKLKSVVKFCSKTGQEAVGEKNRKRLKDLDQFSLGKTVIHASAFHRSAMHCHLKWVVEL